MVLRGRRGWQAGRPILSVLATGLMILSVVTVSRSDAANLYWYGENGSTCWQVGFPGTPSSAGCDSVGASYLPSHMHEGGLGVDLELVNKETNGDFCNYYHIGEGLDTTNENSQQSLTGFAPPTPYGAYQEGNNHNPPAVCQAYGSTWGEVVRGNGSNNFCNTPEAPCGMQHFVSLGGLGTKNRPWSTKFGEPALIVSSQVTIQTVVESPNSWGYVCPLLKGDGGGVIEFCLEEWHVGSGIFPAYKHYDEASTKCTAGGDQTFTGFASGTKFAQRVAGSSETFEFHGATSGTFTARITPADLQEAIKAVEGKGCGPQSQNASEYTLVGIEQGVEGGGVNEIGGHTSQLELWTEYTPPPPVPSTWAVINSAENNTNVFYKNTSAQLDDEYLLNEAWSNRALVSGLSSTSAAIENSAGTDLDVFYGNPSGELMAEYLTAGGEWANVSLASGLTGTPGAIENNEGTNMNVFYRNTFGELADEYFVSGTGWSPTVLHGEISASPAAIENTGGTNINAFYRATKGGQLADEYFISGTGWANKLFATSLTGSPAALENTASNNINVFYLNSNGHLADEYFTSAGGWASSPMVFTETTPASSPTAVENTAGTKMDVFYKTTGGQLADESWTVAEGWTAKPKVFSETSVSGMPSAVENQAGTKIDVFYRNGSEQLVEESSSNGTWGTPVVRASGMSGP